MTSSQLPQTPRPGIGPERHTAHTPGPATGTGVYVCRFGSMYRAAVSMGSSPAVGETIEPPADIPHGQPVPGTALTAPARTPGALPVPLTGGPARAAPPPAGSPRRRRRAGAARPAG